MERHRLTTDWTIVLYTSFCLLMLGGCDSGAASDGDFMPCDGPDPSAENAGYIHGKVIAAENDAPIKNAAVRLDGIEGCVSTDSDGKFVFPKAGGGRFGLTVTAAGRTHARRVAAVETGHDTNIGTMVLPKADSAVTMIGPEGGRHRSAAGGLELTFPAGALDAVAKVRATRFGAGRELPGKLPETSHFTMALEATAGDGKLNQPVTITIPNDYGFPAGTQVPVGVFNEETGEWVPDGMGVISEDGSQVVYEARHFSAFDCNYPVTTKAQPGMNGKDTDRERDPCNRNSTSGNSLVDIRSGLLRLDFDLPLGRHGGTERTFGLVYQSGAATPVVWSGGSWKDEAADPKNPEYAGIEVQVEGVLEKVYVGGATENNWAAYMWDGRNGRGTALPTGVYDGWIRVYNAQKGTFAQAAVFGGQPTYSLGIEADELVEADTVIKTRFQLVNGRESDVGRGWYLKGIPRLYVHADGSLMVVRDGESGGVYDPDWLATRIAGTDTGSACADGDPIIGACIQYPKDLVVEPDGGLLTTDDWYHRIVRLRADGGYQTVFSYDDGAYDPQSLAVGPDGTIWFGDADSGKVFKLVDGLPVFVVGGDMPDLFGTTPTVSNPTDLDFDANGNLYIADWPLGLRRLSPEGVLTNAYAGTNPDIPAPSAIDVVADGSVLLVEPARQRVRRLTADGQILPVAGIDGAAGFSGDGWVATKAKLSGPSGVVQGPDGTVYIADGYNDRVRAVGPDGIIRTFAGKGSVSGSGWGDGGPATDTMMTEGTAPVIDLDGNVLLLDHMNGWIWKYDLSKRVFARPPSQNNVITQDIATGMYTMLSDEGEYRFDSAGLMLWSGGIDGDPMTVLRDESGRITGLSYASGDTVTLQWDGDALESISGPHGRNMSLTVDGDRNVTSVTFADGARTALSYDADGRLDGWTDADGRTAGYTLDRYGRVSAVTSADGTVRRYKPLETQGLINEFIEAGTGLTPDAPAPAVTMPAAEYTDATGRTWKYKYDALGEATEVTLPDGLVVQMGNHTCGMPSSVTIPGDYAKVNFYDEWGRILVEKDPAGDTEYQWDESGELTGYSTPGGRYVEYEYTADGEIAAVKVGGTTIQSYEYADGDRLAAIVDALGRRTEYAWDDSHNLESVTQSGIRVAAFGRNDAGEITSITDAVGGRTEFMLDSMGRVNAVRDAAGNSHNIGLDGQGQPVSLTTVAGDVSDSLSTTWGRDARGRVNSVSILGAPAWSLEMDGENRVTAIVSPLGRVTAAYDDQGRVISREIHTTGAQTPDSAATFEYDPDGHLISARDYDSTVTWEYDALTGALLSVTQSYEGMVAPITLTYEMDADGWVNAITYPALSGFDGGRFDYSYHGASGNLDEITAPDGRYFDLYRDDLGRLTEYEVDWGDSFEMTRTYDQTGYLQGVTAYLDSYREEVHMQFQYGTDDDGAIVLETGPDGTTEFAYDPMRRLNAAVNSGTGTNEAFDYNGRGEPAGAGFEYDAARRMIAGGGYQYEYDEAGRVIRREKLSDGTAMTLSWDGDDNLVAARTFASGSTTPEHEIRYGYDALGRRIYRDVDGARTFFVYDFADVVLELNETGGADAFYLHEPSMENPIAMYREGEAYACIQDGRGSIRGLVRLSDRSLARTWEYSAFGSVTNTTGTVPFIYGFQGRDADPITGLVNFRSRQFDPAIGRFLSTDPEKFTSFANTYAFPGNDPVNRRDPTGAGPRIVTAAGEVYSGYNARKQMIEQGVDAKVSAVAGREAGAAAGYVWKTAGSNMIDSMVKVTLPSPYQSPGPNVTDAAVWLYKGYKAKDPCARAQVAGDMLVDIMPAGDKWLRPMVDNFNNFGNLMNSGK